jgi:hypothetical protein
LIDEAKREADVRLSDRRVLSEVRGAHETGAGRERDRHGPR